MPAPLPGSGSRAARDEPTSRLVDDLITMGTRKALSHVYFAREYRAVLKTNADLRLTRRAGAGLVDDQSWRLFFSAKSLKRSDAERKRLAAPGWQFPPTVRSASPLPSVMPPRESRVQPARSDCVVQRWISHSALCEHDSKRSDMPSLSRRTRGGDPLPSLRSGYI